jgi:uncharacterized protein (TIGR02246 family)
MWPHAIAIGLLATVTVVGCSSGQHERTIGAARVEPELASQSSRRAAGPVPVVIAPARPFHTAVGGVHPAAEPRRVPAVAGDATTATRLEVEAAIAGYLRAFNRHDTAAVVAHWSERGENVDLDSGETTVGREAVHDVFAALFARDDAAAIDIDVHAIRPVRRDVAVVDGTSTVRFGDGARAGSRFSAVMVRHDGRWLLEQVRESACPVPAAHQGRPLDQLAWLVGSWEDAVPGTVASTRCFWSAGRAFLIRNHAVTTGVADRGPVAGRDDIPGLLATADPVEREVTEIIGWDPESQAIRSWVFTSAGTFAEGIWTREADGWKVRIEGRGSDAGQTTECLITRRGDDEFAVRGNRAGFAAHLMPVSDFIRTDR